MKTENKNVTINDLEYRPTGNINLFTKNAITKQFSKREIEILRFLTLGFRSRQIASFLITRDGDRMSEKTVSTYIKRMAEKCGLSKNANLYLLVIEATKHYKKYS